MVLLDANQGVALGVVLDRLLGVGDVALHAADGVGALGLGEKPGGGDVGGQEGEGDAGDEDGDAALDEEDELPAVQVGRLDGQQAVGEQAGEGAGDGVHAAEEAHAQAQRELGVHGAEEVEGRLGEAALGGAK